MGGEQGGLGVFGGCWKRIFYRTGIEDVWILLKMGIFQPAMLGNTRYLWNFQPENWGNDPI